MFPLVVLVSSVVIGLLLVHEGFVGISAKDRAAQEAVFEARQKTYEQGSHVDATQPLPSSLSQGSLYNERRLTLQNEEPVPTEVPILYGPQPSLQYSDPIAVQVNPPPTYPFPTADKDTCVSSCCD